MNTKQELEKMRDELGEMEDKAHRLAGKLNEVWWKLRDETREELD